MESTAIYDRIIEYLTKGGEIFTQPLFTLGTSEISLSTVLYFFLAFIILFFVASKIKKFLTRKVLVKAQIILGLRESIGMITKFVIIIIGSTVVIQSAGIDLSTLSILAGALGVGIGFGLQNITNKSCFWYYYFI